MSDLTVDYLLKLEKFLQEHKLPKCKYMLCTLDVWLKLRENHLVDFTDEEITSGKNPFKVGRLDGYGKVSMFIERRIY